jgi:hypothetical protein
MLKSAIVRNCVLLYPSAWPVTIVGAVSAAASAIYAVGHFAISTNIEKCYLTRIELERPSEAFQKAFPRLDILAMVEAPAPELVERATVELAQHLASRDDLMQSVR